MATAQKIDFVIPWVDGGDPSWQAEFCRCKGVQGDASPARFRDWGILKYWFRGVERFAPWVNRIHFVTWGHLPEWLNQAHPKLNIVRHTDYIPANYLPTFSANTIELNLHRIPGLAEQFVYFNDDTFLTRPMAPRDFFRKGLPCDSAILSPPNLSFPDQQIPIPEHVFTYGFNDIFVINAHFQKRDVLKRHWRKFFSLKYGAYLLSTVCMLPYRQLYGFYAHHLPASFLKRTFEQVWQENPEVLDLTCRHTFRAHTDVNQWLMQYYQYCQGAFEPVSLSRGRCFDLSTSLDEALQAIRQQRYKMVCCNDSPAAFDVEHAVEALRAAFDALLPQRSAFEM